MNIRSLGTGIVEVQVDDVLLMAGEPVDGRLMLQRVLEHEGVRDARMVVIHHRGTGQSPVVKKTGEEGETVVRVLRPADSFSFGSIGGVYGGLSHDQNTLTFPRNPENLRLIVRAASRAFAEAA